MDILFLWNPVFMVYRDQQRLKKQWKQKPKKRNIYFMLYSIRLSPRNCKEFSKRRESQIWIQNWFDNQQEQGTRNFHWFLWWMRRLKRTEVKWHQQSLLRWPFWLTLRTVEKSKGLEGGWRSLLKLRKVKKSWEKEDRMAGIIAQMTRAKRDRDKKKTYVTEKCM